MTVDLHNVHPMKPLTAEDLRGDRIQPGHVLFGIVWVNPERMSGAACFAGTRVPVKSLFDHLEAGDTLDDFLEGFPGVTRAQALAVMEMAAEGFLKGLGPA